MTVSEFVWDFLQKHGVDTVYMVSGSTAMWLTDALNRNEYLNVICNNHEQGRFSPATHIPIVGKEHLKDEPVDAIIILGPMYVDEIVKEIRETAGLNVKIAFMNGTHLQMVA